MYGTSATTNIQSQRPVFLDAPKGTGKTIVTTAIQLFLQSRGKFVLHVASTVAASQLHDGGLTARSGLKIPILVTSGIMGNVDADPHLGHDFYGTYLII